MKIDREKIFIFMARSYLSLHDIAHSSGVPLVTIQKAIKRGSARPATVGKIARALGVDVECIIRCDTGEGEQEANA